MSSLRGLALGQFKKSTINQIKGIEEVPLISLEFPERALPHDNRQQENPSSSAPVSLRSEGSNRVVFLSPLDGVRWSPTTDKRTGKD